MKYYIFILMLAVTLAPSVQANVIIDDFEDQNLDGWTVTGNAWTVGGYMGSGPYIAPSPLGGEYFARSGAPETGPGPLNEANTGTARSPLLKVMYDTLEWLAVGWSGETYDTMNSYQILDGSLNVIHSLPTPQSDNWVQISINLIDLGLSLGDNFYFQAVDNKDQAHYSWLAFDNLAFAGNPLYYGPACGKAVIDGIVIPAEWTNASTKTFQLVNSANQTVLEATLRVMNDRNFLYLGITINDDEFSPQGKYLPQGDGFRIDFDDDHSGSLFVVGDDVLSISAGSPQFFDGYISEGITASADTGVGGTIDGVGAASRQGSMNHFELKHPICSGDQNDFCLQPGDIIGFRLEYLDASASGTFDGSYLYPGSQVTSIADIVIADCPFFINLPIIIK